MTIQLELNHDGSEKIQYDFSEYPIYIRYALLSNYPNYRCFSHWHDAVEFIVILHGSMLYNINGEIIPLQKGEGIFVNSRQLHFGFSKQTECHFLCILLHPLLFCISPAMEQQFVSPMIQNEQMPYIKLLKQNIAHVEIMQKLKQIYDVRHSPTAPLKIQSAFSAIWAMLYNENEQKIICNKKISTGDITALKHMVTFIQQHYYEKISLYDIAKSGAVGQSKCCKLFRSYINQTPNAYLISYRLNQSTKLLCNTDKSISDIAFDVGFHGASYYSETFRKWFGISPTEYKYKNKAE